MSLLQYLALVLCQQVMPIHVKSLESHWSVVKRTRRYLNGTATHGFLISPTNCMVKPSLKAYSDYYWSSDSNDRLPTSGSCIYFRPNLVALSSNKQSLMVRYCSKAEYHALTYTTSVLLWMESFPNESHFGYKYLLFYVTILVRSCSQ